MVGTGRNKSFLVKFKSTIQSDLPSFSCSFYCGGNCGGKWEMRAPFQEPILYCLQTHLQRWKCLTPPHGQIPASLIRTCLKFHHKRTRRQVGGWEGRSCRLRALAVVRKGWIVVSLARLSETVTSLVTATQTFWDTFLSASLRGSLFVTWESVSLMVVLHF